MSLERGNCDSSCVAYTQLGLIAGSRFGDYEGAYRFGRLSYDLVEKRGLKRFQARVYNNFAVHVLPFASHLKVARELLRRSYEAANRNGDLTFAAYSSGNLVVNLLTAGEPLVEVEREAELGLALTRKMRFGLGADIIMSQLQLVRTLRGSTRKFGSFDDAQFDELEAESRFACNPDLQLAECWYWIRKVEARFLAGDYASAVAAASAAQKLPWTSLATLDGVKYHYFGALSHAAVHDFASPDERRRHLEILAAHHRQLDVWAQRCPENFETRAALVGAEIARIEGRLLDAERLYEQAIRSARANGFVHCEAIAYELAARFYKGRGFEEIGRLYLQNARNGYLRWGADGKVRQLEDANPQITDEGALPGPTSTILTPVGRLDLATVIKVSQALSAEIVLEKLLDTLMRTAIEQAGADRGLLILPSGAEQQIAVEATISGESVIVSKIGETVTSAKLPDSVLRFVMRTHESVILDEATGENPFSADLYIRQQQPLSILCLPLINQGRLIGILYLENKLASHVFAPGRVLALKLLASQAAISLENSRLYQDLKEREAKIRRLVDANIIGIFFWNFEGRILDANDAFLRIIGYDRGDLEAGALRWTELTPPDWRERDEQWVREHKATGRRPPIEKEYFRKDGSRAPILLAAATFDNSETEGVGFVLDLTERKRAEEALRQRDAAIRGLADSNILGIAAWEFPDTRIIEANDAFLRIVGYEREGLIADRLTLLDLTPGEWKSLAIQNLSGLERGETGQPFEKEYLRKDGSRVSVIAFGTLFDEGATGAKRGVSFAIDLTERKRTDEAIRDMRAQLEHANRVATMGQLTASIAHEVNQPITGSIANAQAARLWLNRPTPDLNEARLAIDRIVRDGTRASAVVGRIRDLIKKAPPRRLRVEINVAIREVIELTRHEALKNGVSVHTELGDDLPTIEGDRVELQQVILNLIFNAVEAMKDLTDGPRDVCITTGKTEAGETLVSVRDSGPGLAPEVREKLFMPFETTKPTGMGLGLSICRSIIEAHGGRLWASDNAPRGAVFQFTLPPHRDAASND